MQLIPSHSIDLVNANPPIRTRHVVPVEEVGLHCAGPGQQEGNFTLHGASGAAVPEASTQPPATAPRSLCLWEMLPL